MYLTYSYLSTFVFYFSLALFEKLEDLDAALADKYK